LHIDLYTIVHHRSVLQSSGVSGSLPLSWWRHCCESAYTSITAKNSRGSVIRNQRITRRNVDEFRRR